MISDTLSAALAEVEQSQRKHPRCYRGLSAPLKDWTNITRVMLAKLGKPPADKIEYDSDGRMLCPLCAKASYRFFGHLRRHIIREHDDRELADKIMDLVAVRSFAVYPPWPPPDGAKSPLSIAARKRGMKHTKDR